MDEKEILPGTETILDSAANPTLPETLAIPAPDTNDTSTAETSLTTTHHESQGSSPPLSKNAQKRLAKLARFEAGREDRIRRNKERKQAKRESLRASILAGTAERPAPRTSLPRQEKSPLRVLIDCSFDALMTDREIKSMCAQLTRCYAENRVARRPCTLIMTSWDDKIAARFQNVFQNQQAKWNNVQIHEAPYLSQSTPTADAIEAQNAQTSEETLVAGIDKADLIYLSADAEETIHTLDESKVYIIGGIVDKNRYKNLCQEKAQRQGIKTAKLPIGEYIQMASRKVLTVNHVFEIMSQWLETKDWEKAFLKVIPKRKLPTSSAPGTATDAAAVQSHAAAKAGAGAGEAEDSSASEVEMSLRDE